MSAKTDRRTAQLFEQWRKGIEKHDAVPLFCVCGITEGRLQGNLITVNSQGRGPQETIAALEEVLVNLKKNQPHNN